MTTSYFFLFLPCRSLTAAGADTKPRYISPPRPCGGPQTAKSQSPLDQLASSASAVWEGGAAALQILILTKSLGANWLSRPGGSQRQSAVTAGPAVLFWGHRTGTACGEIDQVP